MNRHERRKNKKNIQFSQKVSKDLINGIKFHTNKDYENAKILYNRVLNSEPLNYNALRHLGILYQDQHNYREAYEYFIKAVKANTNGFEALNNLGTIHLHNKSYDLALKCFKRSLEINNKYVPTINNLAGYYHKKNEAKKSLHFATQALELQPDNPMAQNQYAKALIINSKLEEAIELLEKLNKQFPENDDFKFNLSSAYREIGEFNKANEITIKEFKKNYKKLHYFLSFTSNKENTLEDAHINYYDSLLDEEDVSSDDKTVICHAFFGYFKNLKNYKKAGEYLIRGNLEQYSKKDFNLANEKKYFQRIREIFSERQELLIEKQQKKQVPIFICGMPRSGTTLCEQILSSHSKIDGAGELNYLAESSGLNKLISPDSKNIKNLERKLTNKKDLMQIRKNYLELLGTHGKEKSSFICDKMPHNFILIGLIKQIFPEAKVIYCKRNPIDNCFSLFSHKFVELSHQYSYDQRVLAKYYKLHVELMNFYQKMFNNGIFVLDNEELVNNQESISRSLISFCGLKWENSCLDFHKNKRQVRTASIEQVRKPINKKSIGAWKKYEDFLQQMVAEINS